MRRISIGIGLFFVALVSACASNNSVDEPIQQAAMSADSKTLEEIKLNAESLALVPSEENQFESDNRSVCTEERRTGSYIPSSRCRTKRERSEESDRAQEWMRELLDE